MGREDDDDDGGSGPLVWFPMMTTGLSACLCALRRKREGKETTGGEADAVRKSLDGCCRGSKKDAVPPAA
jgi:hypothetical protein